MHAAALLLTIALTTVSGRAINHDAGLPGCTVTLQAGSMTRTTVTDAEGRYTFPGVPEARYELLIELAGLEPSRQDVDVTGDSMTIPVTELRLSETAETITLACGPACGDVPAESRYGFPLCSDERLDSALIDAAKNGDRSAVTLLEQRYARAGTYLERHRLGAALLRKSSQDASIWNELIEVAELVARFPDGAGNPSEAYLQWCAQRGVGPTEHWWMASDAVDVVASDPRSRPLLLQLLETNDPSMIGQAIHGLATQRDFTALPAIERALERHGDGGGLALLLASFADEGADTVARKYLTEDYTETYDQFRAQSALDRER